ncbi:hypothetical protein L228DRAFT_285110 [Xylona heveae TC161]|uniref:Uncharacterized protein n=1 Tax=Xylona heveae (strain CBS 132557 / TC161) TaxID=1328760 RepID=A0A165AFR5_XYLHT|nr:hypothetical protein L228DRAFT_285110 [Xylona heveae TC161]KZF20402.1 hypothetical protein L228DRAFT_285110 [Xylona heveae TC161]
MHEGRPHPLLAQVPLTVSPFVSLPTANTLPYTYQSLPSTLPPSIIDDPTGGAEKPKYVVSSSGHAAHPDDIIASCRALQSHLEKLRDDAEKTLRKYDEDVKQQDLAEKRKIAPGWLDSDAKLLEPEKKAQPNEPADQNASAQEDLQMIGQGLAPLQRHVPAGGDGGEGEELDRAFGGLGLR